MMNSVFSNNPKNVPNRFLININSVFFSNLIFSENVNILKSESMYNADVLRNLSFKNSNVTFDYLFSILTYFIFNRNVIFS